MDMLLFLLKASLCLMVFYLPYRLVLRHSTFFVANRIYLLAGLVLSFTIPVIRYSPVSHLPVKVDLPFYHLREAISDQAAQTFDAPQETMADLTTWLLIIYTLGVMVSVVRIASTIIAIWRLQKQGEVILEGAFKVIKGPVREAFSFARLIFLPLEPVADAVLQHEKIHVRQFHWVDLHLLEVATAILWFNPIVYWYRQALKQQHEYLADRAVLRLGTPLSEYLKCLAQTLTAAVAGPISQFNFQSIKQRINMLSQKRSPSYLYLCYGVVLPLAGLLLFAFTAPTEDQKPLDFTTPVAAASSTVSDGFGERIHPRTGKKRMHTGLDLIAPPGVPVLAAEAGTVTLATRDSLRGNFVVIWHDGTFSTTYSHLQAPLVRRGDKVTRGQKIAEIGETGATIKSHLHFEVLRNSEAVDPKAYLPDLK